MVEVIREVLTEFKRGDFYVGDQIPQKKIANATAALKIDSAARVVGLIDVTLFGSCDEGMAFCESGIYWRTALSDTASGFIDWPTLVDMRGKIFSDEKLVYFGTRGSFNPAGSKLSSTYVARTIIELTARLKPFC